MKHRVTSPRFAIVLGCGGIRCIAALGMSEVLSREGLHPDLVVGCSAGALFGALIAAGHDAREAVHIATTLWSPEITRQRLVRYKGYSLSGGQWPPSDRGTVAHHHGHDRQNAAARGRLKSNLDQTFSFRLQS